MPGPESLADTNNCSCSKREYFVQDYAWEDLIPFMREQGQAGDRRERDRAVGAPMKDRVVLITNVEHFVGRPVATELVTQGAAVVCHDKSFADAAEAKAFAAANPALTVVRAQTLAEIVARATEACGRVDVVVCNDAGAAVPHLSRRRARTNCVRRSKTWWSFRSR